MSTFLIDGRKAYAYTGGRPLDPAEPLLVFVHGAQLDHSVWALQSRYFAHHGFSVLAVDLPGHGRSEGPALDSIAAMSRWLAALLDAAGARPVHLIGHSMGALIGLELSGVEFSGSQAGRLLSLTMMGVSYPMSVSPALLEMARDDERQAIDMINGWSHATLNHHPGSPGPGFSVFMSSRQLMLRQPPGTLHTSFAACNAYDQGELRAAALKIPTLLVLGQRDQMTPMRSGRALAARIGHARVVEVEQSGHSLMTERPDAVLQALREFLILEHRPS